MTEPLDWSSLGFGFHETDWMYVAEGDTGRTPVWASGRYLPFADLALSPAAALFSYGCGVFEGLKAERDLEGQLRLFRPQAHGERFARSAERLALPAFPVEELTAAVAGVVRRNERFVPPPGKGSFYCRPMMHGIEPILGARRPRRARVAIYGSPVGAAFPMAKPGLRLQVQPFARAAVGGTGGAKAVGNYAGVIALKEKARAEGFDDLLFLDGSGPALEQVGEAGGANFFCLLESGELVTPPLDDTILPGITRDSVIRIAREMLGLEVTERPLAMAEVRARGQEAFCTGTAWTVSPVAMLGGRGWEQRLGGAELATRILAVLRGIQAGAQADPFGWTFIVPPLEASAGS